MSLREVARPDLLAAAEALRSGQMTPPYTDNLLARYSGGGARLAAELRRLHDAGLSPQHLAEVLRLVADEGASGQAIGDRVELVWTGPELQGATSRSTATVVRELVASATESVLLSTYSLDHPKKIKVLLGPLKDRMSEAPTLKVSVFVNVGRKYKDTRPHSVLLREFADTFRKAWGDDSLPKVFHDPRALEPGKGPRACLHAKCVIVDGRRAFVSSANLSEAAQERNIEAGVVIEDEVFARDLGAQFESLVRAGLLVRVPGIA